MAIGGQVYIDILSQNKLYGKSFENIELRSFSFENNATPPQYKNQSWKTAPSQS